MKRISSSWTFFYKRIFPALWVGFCLLFLLLPWFGIFDQFPPPPFFIVPGVMLVVGFFIMRKLVFDLMDEVWDDGGSLLVRNRGEEQRIAFADIKNVSYMSFVNPPRVVLSLRHNTAFGNQIAFCAPVRFMPFSSSPVITGLIDRIDDARRK